MTTSSGLVKCLWCGSHHPDTLCPRVLSIEYHPSGAVKKIEFKQR